MLEQMMINQTRLPRDPFEGVGARKRQTRLRVEGVVALGMAVGACGLTAALWLRELLPAMGRLTLG
jgi:hypothetical protein